MSQQDPNTNATVDNSCLSAEPPRRSPWSKKALMIRVLWGISEFLFWKPSPVCAWGFRAWLLRLFGAKIGRGVRIHPSVKVIIPWNITLEDRVRVHERAILYALGEICIGEGSEIGPMSHLCAGTHDFTCPEFTLIREPIHLGSRCILGAGSFVAPNVTLGSKTVLMPRSAMYSCSEPGTCYQGNPAKLLSPALEECAQE